MSNVHADPNFKGFIVHLLEKAGLTIKYTSILTNDQSMIQFTHAFTHKSFDPLNNYEYYETIGDVTTNKIVVWYFYRRFPELGVNTQTGNMGSAAIMSRLKQTGVSNVTYARYCRKLGLDKFLRISPTFKSDSLSSVYADLFESFIGCLELLIDTYILIHAGYGICYAFLKLLIDEENIKLERDKLYDPKTILNEYILSFHKRLKMKYISKDIDNDSNNSSNNNNNNRNNSRNNSRNSSRNSSRQQDISRSRKRFEVYVEITDNKLNLIYKSRYGFGHTKVEGEKNAAKHIIDSKFEGLPVKN
jgi:dsRNA-specific ribonuclease